MEIIENPFWIYYVDKVNAEKYFEKDKSGKWMYFFNDKEFVAKICKEAVESGIVVEAKHSNKNNGVSCFYLNCDDIDTHKKVIAYFLENGLIKRTKKGKLCNISFKLNSQTLDGQYGESFKSDIKLDKFVDLLTGNFIIE